MGTCVYHKGYCKFVSKLYDNHKRNSCAMVSRLFTMDRFEGGTLVYRCVFSRDTSTINTFLRVVKPTLMTHRRMHWVPMLPNCWNLRWRHKNPTYKGCKINTLLSTWKLLTTFPLGQSARLWICGTLSPWLFSTWTNLQAVVYVCVRMTDVVCRWKQNRAPVRSEVEAHIKTTVISQILFDQKFIWLLFQSTKLHRHYNWSKMEACYKVFFLGLKCHILLKITAWEQNSIKELKICVSYKGLWV